MIEVEREPNRGRCGHHAIAIEHDQLSLGEQLEMPAVVTSLEALLIGQRRKHHALQGLEGGGMLRPGAGHHQAIGEDATVHRPRR